MNDIYKLKEVGDDLSFLEGKTDDEIIAAMENRSFGTPQCFSTQESELFVQLSKFAEGKLTKEQILVTMEYPELCRELIQRGYEYLVPVLPWPKVLAVFRRTMVEKFPNAEENILSWFNVKYALNMVWYYGKNHASVTATTLSSYFTLMNSNYFKWLCAKHNKVYSTAEFLKYYREMKTTIFIDGSTGQDVCPVSEIYNPDIMTILDKYNAFLLSPQGILCYKEDIDSQHRATISRGNKINLSKLRSSQPLLNPMNFFK